MIHPRRLLGATVLAGALMCSATACSEPDPDAPVVLTGNPADADPPQPTTTTTSTSTTSTTLFFAQQ